VSGSVDEPSNSPDPAKQKAEETEFAPDFEADEATVARGQVLTGSEPPNGEIATSSSNDGLVAFVDESVSVDVIVISDAAVDLSDAGAET
jgi:hypothetical protein